MNYGQNLQNTLWKHSHAILNRMYKNILREYFCIFCSQTHATNKMQSTGQDPNALCCVLQQPAISAFFQPDTSNLSIRALSYTVLSRMTSKLHISSNLTMMHIKSRNVAMSKHCATALTITYFTQAFERIMENLIPEHPR